MEYQAESKSLQDQIDYVQSAYSDLAKEKEDLQTLYFKLSSKAVAKATKDKVCGTELSNINKKLFCKEDIDTSNFQQQYNCNNYNEHVKLYRYRQLNKSANTKL